ncbi:MAG TPA: hypothetical protein VIF33_05325, partial [Casimicrobiaceae bacterium]
CPECRVLKHLARCLLPTPAIIVLSPAFVCDVTPRVAIALPLARVTARLPPARAPPQAIS